MSEGSLWSNALEVVRDRVRFVRSDWDREVALFLSVPEEQDVRPREHLDANPFNNRAS